MRKKKFAVLYQFKGQNRNGHVWAKTYEAACHEASVRFSDVVNVGLVVPVMFETTSFSVPIIPLARMVEYYRDKSATVRLIE